MANTTNDRSHNQPTHEAAVKGGQNSHKNQFTAGSEAGSQSSSGGSASHSHNQPSHEAQVKGGQHSHSGGR